MTDWYVNNNRDPGGWFEKCPSAVTRSLVRNSKTVVSMPGTVDIEQTFQIDTPGGWDTFYYDGGGEIDRVWPYDTGNYTLRWGSDEDYNGQSETYALPTINWALASMLAGNRLNVKWSPEGYLLTNADQMPTAITPGIGSYLNKPIIIEGYKDNLGDMRWGGVHYQSPLHAKVFGVDTTKKITVSGEGALANLLNLNNSDFVIIRNFYFKDATAAIITLANAPRNVIFEHCVFADSDFVMSGVCNGFVFLDCYVTGLAYSGSSYTINCTGVGAKFIGNVIDIGNYTKYGCASANANEPYGSGLHYGNLIIGGLYSILGRAGDMIMNNTAYDGVKGIRLGMGTLSEGGVSVLNNIVMGKDISSNGILVGGSYGAPIVNDNNCFWSLAGAMTNPVSNTVPDGGALSLGPNSIEADPLLSSGFELLPGSPCWQVGLGGVNIGADFGNPAAPAAPVISCAVTDTDEIAVSITGANGATHSVIYMASDDAAFSAGGSRTGDGDVVVGGLAEGTIYWFQAYSRIAGGPASVPSTVHLVRVPASGDVTPTSPLSITIEGLRVLIATSPTFQAAVGATGSDAEKLAFAKQRVYIAERVSDIGDNKDEFTRPFALVIRVGREDSDSDSNDGFNDKGTLDVLFEKDIPEAYKPASQSRNAEIDFSNFVESVAKDIQTISTQPGYLIVAAVRTANGPWRMEATGRENEHYGIFKSVDWGLQ